jgi:hypothetical protein
LVLSIFVLKITPFTAVVLPHDGVSAHSKQNIERTKSALPPPRLAERERYYEYSFRQSTAGRRPLLWVGVLSALHLIAV